MTISSSMNAGVMGLSANATRLAAISDNIANSDTYGYKRTEVDFSSMVLDQRPSTYSAGGVRTTSYNDVLSAGSLTSTGSSTDFAISGRGMIPVTNLSGTTEAATERDFMMVPTGGFTSDQDGFLSTTSGLYLLGWPTDGSGDTGAVSRSSASALEPVNISQGQFAATPTENIKLGLNLPADVSGVTEPYTLPVEYFDALGLSQDLSFEFTPGAAANSWDVTITDDATDPLNPVGSFNVTFDPSTANGGAIVAITPGAGVTYDTTSGEITFAVAGGNINAFIGEEGTLNGLSQLGTGFSPYDISQDGNALSDLQSIEVTPDGFLEAIYDNGARQVIYQIPVADVPNPNGLTAQNSQAYSLSSDSGDLYLWTAGQGPTGDFLGYALTESTTDIAAELTNLIETQRSYASNAKIIQTVDEMLQETTNLKR